MDNNVDLGQVLANNFMLAKLRLPIWSGRKTDKEATAQLCADKGAVEGAASVIVELFAGRDAKLKETRSAYTRIRTWFYDQTSPWTTTSTGSRKGDRVVATANSIDFLTDFAARKKEAELVRDEFLQEYDQLVQDQINSLGGLYDASKYPPKDRVATLFDAELQLLPMPVPSDFSRLDNVPASLVTGLQDIYQRNMETQVNNAMGDIQERLVSELERIDKQLSKVADGERTRLFKTLITNMRQLNSMAKSMAFANADIRAITDEIDEHLLQYEVDVYRDNAALAGDTARKAREIKKRVTDNTVWAVHNESVTEEDTPEETQEPEVTEEAGTMPDFDVDDVMFN